MNPVWITLCAAAQLAILYNQSPWVEGLATGTGLLALLGAFAWTRLKWDSHVDMFLIMIGPGGLGMQLGGLYYSPEGACHADAATAWASFLWMSLGMCLASIPLCWFRARCVLEARAEGRGISAVLIDSIGMELGMALGMVPLLLVHLMDVRAPWLHHGLMLAGMSLGMLAAALIQSARLANRQKAEAL